MNDINKVVMYVSYKEPVFQIGEIIEIYDNLSKPLKVMWRIFKIFGFNLTYRFKVVKEPILKDAMYDYEIELYHYVYTFLGITILTIKYE